MYISKITLIAGLLTSSLLSHVYAEDVAHVYAEDVAKLPTIQVMADEELRNEVLTTIVPFQEDEKVREALQHQIIKKEKEIQNFKPNEHNAAYTIQPANSMPDMSGLSSLQQQYVLAVAAGLKSSDPSSGIFKMLEPLGVNRERALEGVRSGTPLEIRFNEQQLNQLFGDKWRIN